MTDAEILKAALTFLGWSPSDLTNLLQLEGTHSRSTTHRWLSGDTPVPPHLKLLLKHHVLEALPCSQKPAKTKVIMVCGTDGGVGVSPFAVTLAHLLSEFGLRTACYHAGRDPIDMRWNLGASLYWLAPRERKQQQEHYLPELNEILADAGRGALDLDCLIIDVSRRLENKEHYDNTIFAADAAIVLTRDWKPFRMRVFDKIKATGTPVKALVKLNRADLYEMKALIDMPSETDFNHLKSTFFVPTLIDSRLRNDIDDVAHLHQELCTSPAARNSPLMQASSEVAHETLRMLGLEFIETVEAYPNDDGPLTLEMVIKQVCTNLPGIMAARSGS